MHDNISLSQGLLSLDIGELHSGYLGDTVTVEIEPGTHVVGPLKSYKFKEEKDYKKDTVAIAVLNVGGFKAKVRADHRLQFVSRFEKRGL